MSGGADDGGSPDTPITPERLADLQAGLLDDEIAARLRDRVRTDPAAARMLAGLDRVRRDLVHLGADAATAPEVPAAVTARVTAALFGDRPTPTHAARPSAPRLRLFAAVAGGCAAVIAVGLGAVMLVREPAPPPTRSAGITAERITVSRAPHDIPLSDPQIMGLLTRRPDYGPLTDPQRRASCLDGLGYSAAKVLGARPLEVDGRPGVLILLPADTPKAVVVLVVAPNCSSAGTELLASTVVTRP